MKRLIDLKGVGRALELQFQAQGIYTPADLLMRFPVKYQSFEEDSLLLAVDKTEITVKGIVIDIPKIVNHRGDLKSLHFSILVEHEIVKVVAFRRDYLKDALTENLLITVKGKLDKKKKLITASAILLKPLESQFKPIYNLEPIYDSVITKVVKQIIDQNLVNIPETLPAKLIQEEQLINRKTLIKHIHLPESDSDIKSAYYRLKYEEALLFQYKMMSQKLLLEKESKPIKHYQLDRVKSFIETIPYDLTQDQKDSVNDIFRDFKKTYPTKRLIQGDVGSGKTIVVAIAIMGAKTAGYQSALMAPTEILAEQHYQNFKMMFKDLNVALLTGSTKNKTALKQKILRGEIDLVIGTHALAIDDVVFHDLGFVVIDEQHRFGVETRESLKNKGIADIVYLTATPIPRTLAIVLFGDMEVSIIKQKPLGRKEIQTRYFQKSQQHAVFEHVKKELDLGHQAFFIAPSIDADERGETVIGLYERVQAIFNHYDVFMLHGKMSAQDKNDTLEQFYHSKGAILVATTVIEVGIDMPLATMMVIFDGEYFGLSQLHQLRGRVGRSELQSHCYVISDETDIERLNFFAKTNDGFLLSEYDLSKRGPGEFLGVRQSGIIRFEYADIGSDFDLFLKAKEAALYILRSEQLNQTYRLIHKLD